MLHSILVPLDSTNKNKFSVGSVFYSFRDPSGEDLGPVKVVKHKKNARGVVAVLVPLKAEDA